MRGRYPSCTDTLSVFFFFNIHIHMLIYTYMHINTHIYTYIYIYTHIHIYTHTHTWTYISPWPCTLRCISEQLWVMTCNKNFCDAFIQMKWVLFPIAMNRSSGYKPDTQNCGCARAGNAGNVFPVTAGKRSRHASRHVRHARVVMHAGIAN